MDALVNRKALADTVAYSELGAQLITLSDDGYNICVGSTPHKLILFPTLADGTPDYSKHPDIFNHETDSTAAGRYQLLFRFWQAYQLKLDLPDFGHASQDAIFFQQVKERNGLALIDEGQFDACILRINNIWASLPGSPYGQHTNKLADLRAYFVTRGGVIAESNQ